MLRAYVRRNASAHAMNPRETIDTGIGLRKEESLMRESSVTMRGEMSCESFLLLARGELGVTEPTGVAE